jgi:hypothetical protein
MARGVWRNQFAGEMDRREKWYKDFVRAYLAPLEDLSVRVAATQFEKASEIDPLILGATLGREAVMKLKETKHDESDATVGILAG